MVAKPVTAGGGASNANYCCLHFECFPKDGWLDLKPGEEDTSMIRYYFMRGGLDAALARWKKDFGTAGTTVPAAPEAPKK